MTRSNAALAIAAAVAALGGCGGQPVSEIAGTTSPTVTATPTATDATADATPTAAATKAASGKPTPIGSTLKIGESAVIEYEDATTKGKSTIELTPKSIEKGSLDDFKNIDLDEEQKKSTPYYVTVEVKNIGDGDLSGGSPATYINGVDDRGQQQNEIIFFGEFERCSSDAPKSFKPGDSYEACLTYLVPGGGAIVGMRWIVFDQKTGKSDLTWK